MGYKKKHFHKQKNLGQAMIEYLILLGIILVLVLRMGNEFKTFLGNIMGTFNDTLATHLTVGVCQNNCFYSQYRNGREN
jgi:Flp pilus assembly pilin Flp